jgi:hypothetical protein
MKRKNPLKAFVAIVLATISICLCSCDTLKMLNPLKHLGKKVDPPNKAAATKPIAAVTKPKAEPAKPKAKPAKPKAEPAKPKAEPAKPKPEEPPLPIASPHPAEKVSPPTADPDPPKIPKITPPVDKDKTLQPKLPAKEPILPAD